MSAYDVTITVSDRRTAPDSLTLAPDQNLFARHCAVVRLDDILPNRRLREIPPLSGPLPDDNNNQEYGGVNDGWRAGNQSND